MSRRILIILLAVVVYLNAFELSEEEGVEMLPTQDVIFCKDPTDKQNPNEEKPGLKDMWEEVTPAPLDQDDQPK